MLIHIAVDSAETRRPRPWPQGVPGTSSHVTFRCFVRFVRDVAAFAFDICLYLSLGDYIRIITDIYLAESDQIFWFRNLFLNRIFF
jgi:hypothetical protein